MRGLYRPSASCNARFFAVENSALQPFEHAKVTPHVSRCRCSASGRLKRLPQRVQVGGPLPQKDSCDARFLAVENSAPQPFEHA